MAAQSFANNATTTLANSALAGDASIVVASATGFPSTTPYTILVESELMLVTSGATTTTWGVSRGQEGTAAAAHAATVPLQQEWSVAGLNSLNQGYWPYLSPGGSTGATQATRYMGATTSGAPGSGAFLVGDFIIDRTGKVFICTIAGTPGTWVDVQAAASAAAATASTAASQKLSLGSVAGSVQASPPALPSALYRIQAGTAVATTNGAGGFTVTYPTAFATGIMSVVVCLGDTSASVLTMALIAAQVTNSSFGGQVFIANTGAAWATQATRFNYFAVGW